MPKETKPKPPAKKAAPKVAKAAAPKPKGKGAAAKAMDTKAKTKAKAPPKAKQTSTAAAKRSRAAEEPKPAKKPRAKASPVQGRKTAKAEPPASPPKPQPKATKQGKAAPKKKGAADPTVPKDGSPKRASPPRVPVGFTTPKHQIRPPQSSPQDDSYMSTGQYSEVVAERSSVSPVAIRKWASPKRCRSDMELTELHKTEKGQNISWAAIAKTNPTYTVAQREALLEAIAQLSVTRSLRDVTVHLAVALLDRMFAKIAIEPAQHRLYTMLAVWFATKMEEEQIKMEAKDVARMSKGKQTVASVCALEASVVKSLDFRLTLVTAPVVLETLLFVGKVEHPEQLAAAFLCDLTLYDEGINMKYTPSHVAVSCIKAAYVLLEPEGERNLPKAVAAASPHKPTAVNTLAKRIAMLVPQRAATLQKAVKRHQTHSKGKAVVLKLMALTEKDVTKKFAKS